MIKRKGRRLQFPFGMYHAFHFNEMSWRRFQCAFGLFDDMRQSAEMRVSRCVRYQFNDPRATDGLVGVVGIRTWKLESAAGHSRYFLRMHETICTEMNGCISLSIPVFQLYKQFTTTVTDYVSVEVLTGLAFSEPKKTENIHMGTTPNAVRNGLQHFRLLQSARFRFATMETPLY